MRLSLGLGLSPVDDAVAAAPPEPTLLDEWVIGERIASLTVTDGVLTAVEDEQDGFHYIKRTFDAVADRYTWTIEVRDIPGEAQRDFLWQITKSGQGEVRGITSMNDGGHIFQASSGQFDAQTYDVESLGDGWFRNTIVFDILTDLTDIDIFELLGGAGGYDGDGQSGREIRNETFEPTA